MVFKLGGSIFFLPNPPHTEHDSILQIYKAYLILPLAGNQKSMFNSLLLLLPKGKLQQFHLFLSLENDKFNLSDHLGHSQHPKLTIFSLNQLWPKATLDLRWWVFVIDIKGGRCAFAHAVTSNTFLMLPA